MEPINQSSPRAEGVIGGMRELISTLRGRIVELEAKVAALEENKKVWRDRAITHAPDLKLIGHWTETDAARKGEE